MATGPDVVQALTEAARTMHQQQTVEDTLQSIAEVARSSVPGFDHVGISTLEKDGRVETRASTGPLVEHLDDIQYSLREGPCVDTLRADRFTRATTWLTSTDDARREFLVGSGWAADGAHRELDLHGDGSVRVKQVRLHTDLRED